MLPKGILVLVMLPLREPASQRTWKLKNLNLIDTI